MASHKIVALTLATVVGLVFCLSGLVWAQNVISQALKVFGIAYVVRTFGDDINSFINDLAGKKGIEWKGTTKVVPIISIGSGAYIGAAQVQGPPDRVDDVRAVAQLETRVQNLRGRLLLPVNTSNPTRDVERIPGVGVSSLIDFKL